MTDERYEKLLRVLEADPEDEAAKERFKRIVCRVGEIRTEKIPFHQEFKVRFVSGTRSQAKLKILLRDFEAPADIFLEAIVFACEKSIGDMAHTPKTRGYKGMFGGFIDRIKDNEWQMRRIEFLSHDFILTKDGNLLCKINVLKEPRFFARFFHRRNLRNYLHCCFSGVKTISDRGNQLISLELKDLDFYREVTNANKTKTEFAPRAARSSIPNGTRGVRLLQPRESSVPNKVRSDSRGRVRGLRRGNPSQTRSPRRH